MKATRLLIVLPLAGVLLASGCGGTQPGAPAPGKPAAKAPTVSQEQVAVAAKGDVDPRSLPPPRPALATTPDLSNATYAVHAASLGTMARNGVPNDVLNNLRKLDGKSYGNTADFMAAAKDAIGQTAMDTHQEVILRSALAVKLADAPTGPRGQASLDEAAARSQAGAMMMTPVATKATDYKLVAFDYDKYNIKPEFMPAIKENAQRLLANKQKVVIEGHCDERGTNEYNLALGQRRAEALRQALVADGVPASRLKTISYGEERPLDPGHTEEAWAKNRRAVLTSP